MNISEKYNYDPKTREILEHLAVPFAVYQFIDMHVVPLVISDGFCRLFGYDDKSRAYSDMELDMYRDTHPDDVVRIANAAYSFATGSGRYETIYRTKVAGSSDYRIIHAFGEHFITETGVRLAQVWYSDEGICCDETSDHVMDLTSSLSLALHENRIVKTREYDYLTGLPNLTYFFESCDAGKKSLQKQGGRPVIMFMDFSGMKFFNNRYGFAEGDVLLRSFAKVLASIFGNEHCCRLGADHFLVHGAADGHEDRLQRLFVECRKMNGGKNLPLHVGVYVGQNENVHVSVACDRAKLACASLSGKYETAVKYFSKELSDDAVLKQYIIENIDRAEEEKWIKVYLQPIIRAVNERVCDVEALARWIDPVKGFLSPVSFIPALEDSDLIYKLDLYMLEQILESIKVQQSSGMYVVPHSLNLSRSDFDTCDIVEEVRKRVDDAGISRELITIEITESVIGSNLDFMKEQVERFQKLGFKVWMDDFGSGYSSLDILQCIRFDLLKFDRSFLLRLEEGVNGKILLTEMMKVATSLGMDTVCEGVETREQVDFLREIGCSKLQGFYFSKPMSFETVIELHNSNKLIEHEDPEESSYYVGMGRINLYDLGSSVSDAGVSFNSFFNVLPVAILEISDGRVRYVRSNSSYQNFMKSFFNADILKEIRNCCESGIQHGPAFISAVRQCGVYANRILFDEKMNDGSVVHCFARRIGTNPVNGNYSVCIVVISVAEAGENATYADIARALAADYYNIYVVDLDTEKFIEYTSGVGDEEISLERHGDKFFEAARLAVTSRFYEEDREPFLRIFTREKVIHDLDAQGVFTATYRLIDTGRPVYVNMKITRMHGGNRIILGISNIDSYMRQLEEEKKLRQEKLSLGRIAALSPDYLVLYTVDPATGHYVQYNPSREFEKFGLAIQGDDFFSDSMINAPKAIVSEDLPELQQLFTKDNVMKEIRRNGSFIHHYRMQMNGKTVPTSLRATLVEENGSEMIIVGVSSDEAEYRRHLESAFKKVSSTALIYTHLAHALARGYTDLYYVNTETGEFIEFHTDDEHGVLEEVRRGEYFFERCKYEVNSSVHQDDRESFLKTLDRENCLGDLDSNNVKELIYRRIKDGRTFYVMMKISRMEDDRRFIVIAVSDVDELVRQRKAEKRIEEEHVIYSRLHALTGNFICVYVADPETGSYREFSSVSQYEYFNQPKSGTDFFEVLRDSARIYSHPDDRNRVLLMLTKEHILTEIERNGIFSLGYRIMYDGIPLHIRLRAAIVKEKEGDRLVLGLTDVDAQVRQEEEYKRSLALARNQASVDALTRVRNRHAYLAEEVRLDQCISEHRQPPFAVVIFDVNNLKLINDTRGRKAGDQCLCGACRLICGVFKHSPVFRVGGDEFAVISSGQDYENIDELLAEISRHNENALQTDGIVIAYGMAKYENDSCVAAVFERADQRMYDSKKELRTSERK